MRERIYLACPYSHRDPRIRELRFNMANHVARVFLRQGYNVFSPISMGHSSCQESELPVNFFFVWRTACLSYLVHWASRLVLAHWANRLVVLPLDGWEMSKGVAAEMHFADERGIPIQVFNFKRYVEASRTRNIQVEAQAMN